MKHVTIRSLTLALAAALLPFGGAAYPVRGDESPGVYPLKKRFADLTPDERAGLRAMYEGMPETDEPPFPAAGMRSIMADVSEISGLYKAYGLVSIFVSVDAGGNATGVQVIKAPTLEVAKAISYVLVHAKYKPAVCSGKPCAMEFPFRFNLTL